MLAFVGDPLQINTTADVMDVLARDEVVLTSAPGQTVGTVFYDSFLDSGSRFQLIGRHIDLATGTPIGSEFILKFGTSSGFDRTTGTPIAMADGSFVILAETNYIASGSYGWTVEHYTSSGVFLGDVASGPVGLGIFGWEFPIVVARPDGAVDVFSESSNYSGGSTTNDLVKATYTLDGAIVGAPVTIASAVASDTQIIEFHANEFFSGSASATEIEQWTYDWGDGVETGSISVLPPGAATPITYATTASTTNGRALAMAGGQFAADGSFVYAIQNFGDASTNFTDAADLYRVASGATTATHLLSLSGRFGGGLTLLPDGDFLIQRSDASGPVLALYSSTGKVMGLVANAIAVTVDASGQLAAIYPANQNIYGQSLQYVPAAAPGDLTGDGQSDILVRNASGLTYLYTISGGRDAGGGGTSIQVGPQWQIKGIADFNGDGAADILWSYDNPANAADPLNGASYVSFQNGAVATGGGVVQQLSAVWQVAGVGDFNGDGRADVLYRNAGTGQTYLDIMNGSSVDWAASGFTSTQVSDPNWQVVGVADFNADGNADLLWRYYNAVNAADPLNGVLYEWTMNGKSVTGADLLSQQASGNWQVAGTGDFNGDGAADILLRYQNAANPSDALNGFTYIDFMNGTTVTSGAPTQWQNDNSWQIAAIGDYNGDGVSDILWQQGASATGATLWQMNGAQVTNGLGGVSVGETGWAVQHGVLIA